MDILYKIERHISDDGGVFYTVVHKENGTILTVRETWEDAYDYCYGHKKVEKSVEERMRERIREFIYKKVIINQKEENGKAVYHVTYLENNVVFKTEWFLKADSLAFGNAVSMTNEDWAEVEKNITKFKFEGVTNKENHQKLVKDLLDILAPQKAEGKGDAMIGGGKFLEKVLDKGGEKRKKPKKQTVVSPSGKRNARFEELCRMTEKGLKNHLIKKYNMESGDGWAYRKGRLPILLTAHLDTVHDENVAEIVYDITGNIVSSPEGIGGDDRCGVYMIEKILEAGYDCSVIFFEREEEGSIGASRWCKTEHAKALVDKFNFIIELDRKGKNDVVYYDCDNKDFMKFITDKAPYFKKSWGSMSDISVIAPFLKVAACNFSCGYYNPHTLKEYVDLYEMDAVIREICDFISKVDCEKDKFEYVEALYNYNGKFNNAYGYGYGYGYGYDAWDDDDDYYGASKTAPTVVSGSTTSTTNISGKLTSMNDLIADSIHDDITLTIVLNNGKCLQGSGKNKSEAWLDVLVSFPYVCINDVQDFYFE